MSEERSVNPLDKLKAVILLEQEKLKTRNLSWTEDFERGMKHALSSLLVELQIIQANLKEKI